MARKRITISFSSIIWLAIMGYIFFGGDDNDSKEVTVREQEKPVISETLKEDVKRLGKDITEVVKKAATEIQTELTKDKEEPEPEPPPQREESMVAEPETKPEPEKLKPLDDKPSTGGMKRL